MGVAVFILTGAIMTADRLASAPLPPGYLVVLGIKVAAAAWMFSIARGLGSARQRSAETARRLLLVGAAIYALAMVLRGIYEQAIRL
jgi:hypothetical protein